MLVDLTDSATILPDNLTESAGPIGESLLDLAGRTVLFTVYS